MSLVNISTMLHYKAQQYALKWAEEHLPKEEYDKIYTSYRVLWKKTTIFVITCCIPIMLVCLLFVMFTPISKHMENKSRPINATNYVLAKVDYDGNFYWTHDSQKYEYSLEEYGLVEDHFEFGDKVKVYINDQQEIIEVTTNNNAETIKDIEIGAGCISAILIPTLLIFFIYMPIAHRTFGKSWIEFYKSFEGK